MVEIYIEDGEMLRLQQSGRDEERKVCGGEINNMVHSQHLHSTGGEAILKI